MILGLIIRLIIGLIAGYFASKLMNLTNQSVGALLVLGIIGSFVGGLIGSLIGLQANGFIGSILLSVLGACVFTWAYSKFMK
ncbi:MAG: GlsB/YeaQ/YmgE family stress response membrane protein [Solobacterium sp.]|nr:GlsB/YeaQ/YmgE family stress response membrane protein [Solobacterium sp.]